MEDGFEVVQENKLDFVQTVLSKEDCFKLKEVTPEPSNLLQDNKSEDDASIGIAKPLILEGDSIPLPGPQQVEADATKPAEARTLNAYKDKAQEPMPTPQPISSPIPEHIQAMTQELIKDNTSPGPECEGIGSVEDYREGGLELNE